MLKNWSGFQKWTVISMAVAMLINFCIIMVLITAVHFSKKRLNFIGDLMEKTAEQHIITEIALNDSIPLNSNIHIPGK